MRSWRWAVAALTLGLALSTARPAAAVPITFASRAAFDAAFPGASIENWDAYAAGTTFLNGSTNNGITYTSSTGDAVVENGFLFTTAPNGLGRTGQGQGQGVDFFSGTDAMTFGFAAPLFAFGIDINTFDTTAGGYTATTNTGEVINSVFNPFPGAGTGEFVGFSSTTPFTSVTIAAPGGFDYTLDTLRDVPATTAAVPEPASLTLLGMGLSGVVAARRRRRSQSRV